MSAADETVKMAFGHPSKLGHRYGSSGVLVNQQRGFPSNSNENLPDHGRFRVGRLLRMLWNRLGI